jgi:hypothetical protein
MQPCRWCGDDLTLDCSSAILGLVLLLLSSGPIQKKRWLSKDAIRVYATIKFGPIIHCETYVSAEFVCHGGATLILLGKQASMCVYLWTTHRHAGQMKGTPVMRWGKRRGSRREAEAGPRFRHRRCVLRTSTRAALCRAATCGSPARLWRAMPEGLVATSIAVSLDVSKGM